MKTTTNQTPPAKYGLYIYTGKFDGLHFYEKPDRHANRAPIRAAVTDADIQDRTYQYMLENDITRPYQGRSARRH